MNITQVSISGTPLPRVLTQPTLEGATFRQRSTPVFGGRSAAVRWLFAWAGLLGRNETSYLGDMGGAGAIEAESCAGPATTTQGRRLGGSDGKRSTRGTPAC